MPRSCIDFLKLFFYWINIFPEASYVLVQYAKKKKNLKKDSAQMIQITSGMLLQCVTSDQFPTTCRLAGAAACWEDAVCAVVNITQPPIGSPPLHARLGTPLALSCLTSCEEK